jgi:hypothetical protein
MSSPEPLPASGCAECGTQRRLVPRTFLGNRLCDRCAIRFRRNTQHCPGCAGLKVLAFYDDQGRPACATCTGFEAIYACPRCGREDSPFGRHCGPCTLVERATALLTDPSGNIHPQLQPVFDTLVGGPRPQTTLYWFTRSTGPEILRAMAQGELAISHDVFAAMPSNRTVNYVRDLLVAVGVLPPYEAELERITPWLNGLLATLPKGHAEVLGRFARWHLLRRLRHQEQNGKVTHGAINGARAAIVATAKFLSWLDEHHTTLATMTQTDLDTYVVARPAQARTVASFLAWSRRSGLTRDLQLAPPQRAFPEVTLADEDRWTQVELLLHDDTIRLYTRVAGLFTLLFAQSLTRICSMRADQISTREDGVVTVTFDTVPIELPERLDQLVLQQLARRGQASYASHPDTWLFPGGIPGKHLATENIRGQLVERGIQPSAARKAAMFQLAGQMPSSVLASVLGLDPDSAGRWAALSSRDWSKYAAQRAASLAE